MFSCSLLSKIVSRKTVLCTILKQVITLAPPDLLLPLLEMAMRIYSIRFREMCLEQDRFLLLRETERNPP